MLKFDKDDPIILALQSPRVIWTPLVQIDFAKGTERYSPATYVDVMSAGETWKTGSGIIGVSPVAAERIPSRSIYDIIFADPVHPDITTRWIDKFTEGGAYVGIELSMFMSFWYNGQWTGTVDMYHGRSIQVISEVGEDGQQVTLVEFANELVRLDDNPPLKLTRANLQQRLATDNAFNFITISRNLQFGRKDRE